jgi:Tol biopolymer transport system component
MSTFDRPTSILSGLLAFMFAYPALATAAEPSGLIAFAVRRWEGEYRSRDIPGGVETTPVVGSIWTVRTDGSKPRQVVGPERDANAPAFSPDGQWLYFQSGSGGRHAIDRCRADGSALTTIVSPESVGAPWKSVYGLSIAATGQIVFTVHDGQTGHVAIANGDGSRPRVIAPDSGYLYMAALDPAGDAVVCSGPAAGYRLQRIRLADGKPVVLTPDHPDSFVPQFTPDSRTIIFFRRDGEFYRVGLDGRDLRRLTTGAHHVEFRLSAQDQHGSSDPPHVSPDGRRIAYVADHDSVPNVHIMDLDGSHQRRLTDRKTPCARVRFSPDGRQIAFVSFEVRNPQLFVVPTEGGPTRQLTALDGAVYFLAWQPGNR